MLILLLGRLRRSLRRLVKLGRRGEEAKEALRLLGSAGRSAAQHRLDGRVGRRDEIGGIQSAVVHVPIGLLLIVGANVVQVQTEAQRARQVHRAACSRGNRSGAGQVPIGRPVLTKGGRRRSFVVVDAAAATPRPRRLGSAARSRRLPLRLVVVVVLMLMMQLLLRLFSSRRREETRRLDGRSRQRRSDRLALLQI